MQQQQQQQWQRQGQLNRLSRTILAHPTVHPFVANGQAQVESGGGSGDMKLYFHFPLHFPWQSGAEEGEEN